MCILLGFSLFVLLAIVGKYIGIEWKLCSHANVLSTMDLFTNRLNFSTSEQPIDFNELTFSGLRTENRILCQTIGITNISSSLEKTNTNNSLCYQQCLQHATLILAVENFIMSRIIHRNILELVSSIALTNHSFERLVSLLVSPQLKNGSELKTQRPEIGSNFYICDAKNMNLWESQIKEISNVLHKNCLELDKEILLETISITFLVLGFASICAIST